MSDNQSNNKRIAKNTMFLYIRMLLVMAITLYTSRVILKYLGVEDFGIYNVVGSIVIMFSFINGTLSSATSRFITVELGKGDSNSVSKIFNITMLCHVIIALFVVFLGETVGLWYFYNKMVIPEARIEAAFWVYQLSIAATVLSITQVPYTSVLIAHENMKVYAYTGLVEAILRLLIVFMLISSPIDKLVYYAILTFFIQAALILIYRYYCIRSYEESKLKFVWDWKATKEIASYSFASLLVVIATETQSQGINLLLNSFFGPIVNAARSIAYQVLGSITKFTSNFMVAVRPQIIKLYVQGRIDEMMHLVEMSGNLSFVLILYFVIPIGLEADYILHLWLGDYPANAQTFLLLIMIQSATSVYGNPRGGVFAATGKLYLINIACGIILTSSFPIAYMFFRNGFPPEYAFISVLITIPVYELVSWIILRRQVEFSLKKLLLNTYVRSTIVFIVSVILPYFLHNLMEQGLIRLFVVGIVNAITVSLCGLFIGLSKSQRLSIISTIQKKLHI